MRALLFRLITFITSFMSLRMAQKLADLLSKVIWRGSEKQRRITQTNIKLCYSELSEAAQLELAQASLSETIKSMFELGIIWKKHQHNITKLIKQVHGLDVFTEALQQNQGLLLAAPHFGNWEVLNLWLSKHPGFAFMYKPPHDKKVEQLLLKNRGSGGATQITATTGGVRKAFKVLKDNNILAILPDQQPKNGQGVYAPFRQQSAYTMTLFSKIAAKTKAPVIFAVAERLADGNGFDLHFKAAPAAIYADTISSVTAMNQVIEDMLSINPAQYQWTYKRFSIQSDDSKPYQSTTKQ